jgi:3-keto-disaccharide hydrolase
MIFLRGALLGLLLASAAAAQNFAPIFDGKSLDGWFIENKQGPGFLVRDGLLICPADGGQKLMTEKEYANFILQFEFRLEPDGNSGIGIRAPRVGQTSKVGMEMQILDQTGPLYGPQKLKPEQYQGSLYDVWPARTGFLKAPGEWNREEIHADGRHIRVQLNGVVILDVNLDLIQDTETLKKHPGLQRKSGHIALLGHQSRVDFRNLRIAVLP